MCALCAPPSCGPRAILWQASCCDGSKPTAVHLGAPVQRDAVRNVAHACCNFFLSPNWQQVSHNNPCEWDIVLHAIQKEKASTFGWSMTKECLITNSFCVMLAPNLCAVFVQKLKLNKLNNTTWCNNGWQAHPKQQCQPRKSQVFLSSAREGGRKQSLCWRVSDCNLSKEDIEGDKFKGQATTTGSNKTKMKDPPERQAILEDPPGATAAATREDMEILNKLVQLLQSPARKDKWMKFLLEEPSDGELKPPPQATEMLNSPPAVEAHDRLDRLDGTVVRGAVPGSSDQLADTRTCVVRAMEVRN